MNIIILEWKMSSINKTKKKLCWIEENMNKWIIQYVLLRFTWLIKKRRKAKYIMITLRI